MKSLSLAAAMVAMVAASTAKADGFVCQTTAEDLQLKIYNHVMPEDGTRVAAIMVLSDPAVQKGNKTIAKFTDVKGTLSNQGASYTANVDLRVKESNRKGELILGTKLGQLDEVLVDVDFSYADPIENGDTVGGKITLVKRNGMEITRKLECERYLKGE
jgi:hypothetical protein